MRQIIKSIVFFALISTSVTSILLAQSLPRKGAFGAQMKNDAQGKVFIISIIKNTTAAQLKLQNGDRILKCNGVELEDIGHFVSLIGEWEANDALELLVERDGKKVKRNGKVKGKPFETSAYGDVTYGSVNFDGGQLRTILIVPKNVANPPVIQFMPGVGCGSLDYYFDSEAPVKKLTEQFVENGIAVYRVEKPGMGDSKGCTPCWEMDFNYEVQAMHAALKELKKSTKVNTENIFLYGHSLGAISSPLVAQKEKVKGIIAWGGISRSWFEYELDIQKEQAYLRNADYEATESKFRKTLPFLYDYYINRMTPEELSKNPEYTTLVKHHFQGNLFHGMHHYTYFQSLNDVDILTAYQKIDCPVLALAGAHDLHTINTNWAKDIEDAVNAVRPNEGESKIIAKTTHHYHTIPTMEKYAEMQKDGSLDGKYVSEHYNPAIVDHSVQWIKDVLSTSAG